MKKRTAGDIECYICISILYVLIPTCAKYGISYKKSVQLAFFNYGRVVACIRERAFWIMQRVYTYVLSYVQETTTERANVSKFCHKGGANCLCILPKTIYLRKAVLPDDFAI